MIVLLLQLLGMTFPSTNFMDKFSWFDTDPRNFTPQKVSNKHTVVTYINKKELNIVWPVYNIFITITSVLFSYSLVQQATIRVLF